MQIVSMYCWASISIKCSVRLIGGRKVIKAEFEWTFSYLLISIDSFFFIQASCTCHCFKEQLVHRFGARSTIEFICGTISSMGLMCPDA